MKHLVWSEVKLSFLFVGGFPPTLKKKPPRKNSNRNVISEQMAERFHLENVKIKLFSVSLFFFFPPAKTTC